MRDPQRVMPVRGRARSGVPRMVGRWLDGIRFEDADVPFDGFFRGNERERMGIWPESSLSTTARIAGRR